MTEHTAISPWQMLIEGAEILGVPLTSAQVADFQRYTEALMTANEHINLTAVRDLPSIITKLHLDSLSLLPPIAAAAGMTCAELRQQPWRVADVGSGGGIPGIPLLLAWPAMRLTLIESIRKKHTFLTRVILLLNKKAEPLSERAEVVGRSPEHREQHPLVVARAVASLPTLLELTLPLVQIGGIAALPKGPKAATEARDAEEAAKKLGGNLIDIIELSIPGTEETRNVVLYQKRHPTPEIYPRRPGLPAKRPL